MSRQLASRDGIERAREAYDTAWKALMEGLDDESVSMARCRELAEKVDAAYDDFRREVHAYRQAAGFYRVPAPVTPLPARAAA